MEDTSQPFDLRALLWRIRRHAWIMALPPIVTLCGASVYYKTMPVVYESSVIISIGGGANVGRALRSIVDQDGRNVRGNERINLVNSTIRNQAFLAAVAERMGVLEQPGIQAAAADASKRYPDVPADEFAARFASASVGRRIQVSAGGDGVRITARSGSAEGAQRLVSTVTDLLIEASRRSSLERVMARGRFSEDQLAVYQERLHTSEAALQAYQESMLRNVMSRSPVTDENVNEAHGVVRASSLEMEQTRARIESAKSLWRRHVPGEDPPTLGSPDTDALERKLADTEASHALASIDASGTRDQLPEIQGRITSTRLSLLVAFEGLAGTLPTEVPEVARSAAAGIATDRAILRTLRAKHDRMAGYLTQFERGIATSPRTQLELSRLETEVRNNRELLTAFQREAQSSQISEAVTTSGVGLDIAVIEPSQLPLRPSAPDATRIFPAAFLLGVLLSVGIVYALEKLSFVIHTVEQAEAEVGSRVLGTVPRLDGLGMKQSFVARRWAALSIILVLVLTGIFHGVTATSHSGPQEEHRAGVAGP